jgi:hypothetical protein
LTGAHFKVEDLQSRLEKVKIERKASQEDIEEQLRKIKLKITQAHLKSLGFTKKRL